MEIGDKIIVVDCDFWLTNIRERYPFIPDLENRMGVIDRIQMTTPITNDPLEEPIYHVRFNYPIEVGVVPEGVSTYGYHPLEWVERMEWAFSENQIKKLNPEIYE